MIPAGVQVFLALEPVDMRYGFGRDLARVVHENGALPLDRALRIGIQVCGALDEAHQCGLVHRDLKPENLFLVGEGTADEFVKVLDFGLAKVTEREMRPNSVPITGDGAVLGTPEFMSPEQTRGQKLDARSDLYSFGVILYELLTGKLPFETRSPLDAIVAHLKGVPIPLAQRAPGVAFPPALQAVMDRALRKQADDRFQHAEDFGSALEDVLAASSRA